MKTLLEKYYHWLAAALLLIHTAINIYCTTRLSITGDELAYYAYGVNMLKGQPQKTLNAQGIPIFNSQMPVNALHALPRAVEQVLRPGLQKSGAAANRDIYHGRLVSVAAALLLGLYIIVWATQLYGRSAGLLSLLLYCCSPNLLAHSQLVGTDAFSYLATMATCYHAWRYACHGGWQSFLYMGLWLGLGQLIKQSLLLLYPVVAVLLLLRPISGEPGRWGIKAVRWTKEMMAVALVSLVVINIGFGGKGSGQALKEYQFVSAPYQGLQQHLGWFSKLPLPLPAPYLQGFDYVAFNVATGPGIEGRSSYGSNYVLGQKTDGRWLWYYYPLCWWYKMPLGFGLLVMVALWGYGRRRKRDFWQSGVFLLWPVLFIAVMFICCNTMYLGIRSTLLVEPLLLVCCGSVAPLINNRLRAWLLALLLAAQLVSVGRWFPHFLPYTNEWLWHKKDAHTVFTDSNIYFQEAGILVQEYLRRHPDVQYEPVQPVTGKVLVSVEAYYDWWNQGRMQWLRDLRLEPVGHLDSGHLLFWVGSK